MTAHIVAVQKLMRALDLVGKILRLMLQRLLLWPWLHTLQIVLRCLLRQYLRLLRWQMEIVVAAVGRQVLS